MKLDTFYQTGAPRRPEIVCNADFVKYCVFGETALDPVKLSRIIEGYAGAKRPLPVNVDFTPSVDHAGYYSSGRADGRAHEDVVVKRRDGKRWQFGLLPGLPYIFPSEEWNAHIANMAKNAVRAGAVGVTLQEIGVFGDTGYEDAFREAWKSFYGFDWPGQALWDDKRYYFMGQNLRSVYMTRQCAQILGAVAREFPDARRVIANHSSPAYYPFSNAAANHDIMALPEVTGFEAQTWSNTMMIPFRFDGEEKARPFITGLYEYGYWSNLSRQFPSKDMFFITDPKGDGFDNVTLDECYSLYSHQIASQLIWGNVYKYNVCVWPDRSYSAGFGGKPLSTEGFNAVINNVSTLQNRVKADEPVVTANRPARLAVVSHDTACFQCGGPDGGITNAGLYGLFAPFIFRGIICDVLPTGEADDEREILGEYDLILMSFDTIKPLSGRLIRRLADYVSGGGTVLCVSSDGKGYDSLRGADKCGLGWWLDKGYANPAEALLAACGVFPEGLIYGKTPSGAASAAYERAPGAEIIETDESGRAVAFSAVYGKGRISYYGVSPELFAEAGCSEILYNLTARLLAERGAELEVKPYIAYRRGDTAVFYASSGDLSLDLASEPLTSGGVWFDIFDDRLPRIETLRLKSGASAVLCNAAGAISSDTPVVMFAPGHDARVTASSGSIEVGTSGPEGSTGTIKIYVPHGFEVTTITVDGVHADYTLDRTSRELYIRYVNRADGLTVRAEFLKN